MAQTTPDQHAKEARALLDRSDRVEPPYADLAVGQATVHALLAIAGQLEALREHGIYRTGDGA
jgi:hypothetical protein